MNDSETLLVMTSFVFGAILYGILVFKGPRLRMINNSNVFFDKNRLPKYITFLLIVAIASLPVGFIISNKASLSFSYAGVNTLLAAITGANFILYRYRNDKKGK